MSRLIGAAIGGIVTTALTWKILWRQQEDSFVDFRKDLTYKRFRKFATIAPIEAKAKVTSPTENDGGGEWAMTMQDFVISLTSSGRSPTTTNDVDQKQGAKPNASNQSQALYFEDAKVKELMSKLVPLIDNDRSGTIDFNEYSTLQTLLAIPLKQLQGALELFDRPNQNRVTLPQFKALLRAMSAGRLGTNNNNNSNDQTQTTTTADSSLARYFFGSDGTQTVTFGEFLGRLAEIRNLIRAIEFQCALISERNTASSASSNSATEKSTSSWRSAKAEEERATLQAIRNRLVGGAAIPQSTKQTANNDNDDENDKVVPLKFDESTPLVRLSDYTVLMALLALASDWTPGLKLYLEKEGNVIDHEMLSRVLRGIDLSSLVPDKTPGIVAVPGKTKDAHTRVYASKEHAEMFCQLMDQNHDGTIDADEILKIAKAHTSFFAAFIQKFHVTPKNFVQQWVRCMQQK